MKRTENFDACVLKSQEVIPGHLVGHVTVEVTCPTIVDVGKESETFEGEGFEWLSERSALKSGIRDAERNIRITLGLGKCVSCVYARAGVKDEVGVEIVRTEVLERKLRVKAEFKRQQDIQAQLNELGDPFLDRE